MPAATLRTHPPSSEAVAAHAPPARIESLSLHLHSRGLAVRVFLTCWLVFALHFATNTVREIYPALSLGDRLSFDVSEYLDLHPDIFEIPGRGAFINNNPGASILGAIPYALFRPVVDGIVARVQRARASSAEPPPDYDTIYPMAREFHRKAYQRGLDVKFGLSAGVLQAFLMDKALYELGYELNHRPDWVHIPLAGLLRLHAPLHA